MMVHPNHPTLDYENDDGHRCPGAPYWHLRIVLQNAHHRLGAAATNHLSHLRRGKGSGEAQLLVCIPTPLKNISSLVGMMTFAIYGKLKNPSHQPVW